ncbi:hypothetical protein J7E25_11870 [Agromyces sp. ISL-38]|uniref:hypothetical protein n=1 Tax=Agromyces sp. ISL-38 TaxID=2819107 RepID=UPI001BEB8840|nr:hypothetical protein [Agromyces sp. ISL-38]MBT2499792.1 hypothetical protein [Agromyces sp. ISL-38]
MPVPTTLAELSSRQRRRLDQKRRALSRFAADELASATPQAVRHPHGLAAWLRMTADERGAHIHERAVELTLAMLAKEHAEAEVAREEYAARFASAEPVAPTKRPPLVAGYVVPCSRGCGAWLPARCPRPVLARCAGGCPKA